MACSRSLSCEEAEPGNRAKTPSASEVRGPYPEEGNFSANDGFIF